MVCRRLMVETFGWCCFVFFVAVCWLMLLLRLVVCLVFGGVCD